MSSRSRKILTAAAILALVAGLAGAARFLGGKAIAYYNRFLEENFEEVLARTAERMNADLPREVDETLVLQTTAAGPGRQLRYIYTFKDRTAGQFPGNRLKGDASARVRESSCTSEDTAFFFENGATIVYQYRGSQGQRIGEIRVTPADCGY